MEQRTKCPSFDELASLYARDANAFEILRRQLLMEAIDDAPASRRPALESLLAKIESERAGAATPLDAAARAFDLMMESFGELQRHWRDAYFSVTKLQAAIVIERARQASD